VLKLNYGRNIGEQVHGDGSYGDEFNPVEENMILT
jgi:hypothetical protein